MRCAPGTAPGTCCRISPQQMHAALGDAEVERMAGRAGLTGDELTAALSQHLPGIVSRSVRPAARRPRGRRGRRGSGRPGDAVAAAVGEQPAGAQSRARRQRSSRRGHHRRSRTLPARAAPALTRCRSLDCCLTGAGRTRNMDRWHHSSQSMSSGSASPRHRCGVRRGDRHPGRRFAADPAPLARAAGAHRRHRHRPGLHRIANSATRVFIGDQADPAFLGRVLAEIEGRRPSWTMAATSPVR